MKNAKWILGFIAALIVWHFLKGYIPVGDNTMEYRGQTYHLTKYYTDYDDYKNDPHNLREDEILRIQKAMREARIGPAFKDLEEFNKAYCDMAFPGYGLGNMVGDPAKVLLGGSIEIPGLNADRCFVVRKEGDHYRLIDDFVTAPGTALVCKVKMEGNILRYYDYPGHLVREKKLEPTPTNN